MAASVFDVNQTKGDEKTFRVTSVALLVIGIVLTISAYWPAVSSMAAVWWYSEEYSHGLLIPIIAAYLLWRQRGLLEMGVPSWLGMQIVSIALLVYFLGKLSAVLALQQYTFAMTVCGLMIASYGIGSMRHMWMPLSLLFLMVPPPNFFMNNLSAQLQLISSQLGVWVMRGLGIGVYLEGNVIDLGNYKLQVAEACSGLRYLFPLMTLGFLISYLFRAAVWKRTIVFLSSIPVTIGMNSLRIALIGFTVDRWGVAMAEGLLHDFEGWIVFMLSGAILMLEVLLLARIGNGKSWQQQFGLSASVPTVRENSFSTVNKPFLACLLTIGCAALIAVWLPERVEATVLREKFSNFPTSVGGWNGRSSRIDSVYLDVLKLTDYINIDYSRSQSQAAHIAAPINFYVAWYASQRSGQSAHSPRSCLPGGGWHIDSLAQYAVPNSSISGVPLIINRALIRNGQQSQLVYYWFQQRGRVISNEYLVKWYLFWDSLTRSRTDGALVRIVMPLQRGASIELADAELARFTREIAHELPRFVPN